MATEEKQEGKKGFSQEGIQDFLDGLQERVQERRTEVRGNVRNSKVFKGLDKRRLDFEEQLDEGLTKLLGRVGVPSRQDLRKLERKVSRIDRDYQKLHKSQLAKAHAKKTSGSKKAAASAPVAAESAATPDAPSV